MSHVSVCPSPSVLKRLVSPMLLFLHFKIIFQLWTNAAGFALNAFNFSSVFEKSYLPQHVLRVRPNNNFSPSYFGLLAHH